MAAAIYFDNNASTPMAGEVVEAMRPALEGRLGNASSIHARGQAAKAALEQAREQIASLIGGSAAEIVFTSGGTESDNLAVRGALGEWHTAHPGVALPHLVTTRIEHHAVLNVFEDLEHAGYPVTYVRPNPSGVVEARAVAAALRPETALVSVMMANNETGVLQPIAEIAAAVRTTGAVFHVDAIQAAGKVPVATRVLGCDLLSLSGHKLHGPSGVGALWVRRGVRLQPMLLGGRHERERRAGSENLLGIVGMGAAAELAQATLAAEAARLGALRDRLEHDVLGAVADCHVTGVDAPRVPNTSNIQFDGIEGEALVIALDLHGFCCSTGAACTSGTVEPSHVLVAMGRTRAQARSCLRFSLGRQNTAAEVQALLEVLPPLVQRQRQLAAPLPGRARQARMA